MSCPDSVGPSAPDPVDPQASDPADPLVCSCLRVTECQLLATLASEAGTSIRTLRDLRQATGAGDGCTACHATLRRYLTAHAQVTRGPARSASAGPTQAVNV